MRKVLLTIVLIGLAAIAGVLIMYGGWMFLSTGGALSPAITARLRDEGRAAVATRDVPVSAVLLYGDSVIGAGHNTVRAHGNAGGHAEINAISDAIAHMGLDTFMHLPKDSLRMVTTFEPCLMCRGAILEYGIKHVEFLKGKSVWFWLREDLRTLRYQWARRNRAGESLQDSLFELYWKAYPAEAPANTGEKQ